MAAVAPTAARFVRFLAVLITETSNKCVRAQIDPYGRALNSL